MPLTELTPVHSERDRPNRIHHRQLLSEAHRRLAVAPIMELTDRHFRYLARLMSRHVLLYSEMLTAKAVIHGDREYLLGCDPVESPVVLQLGGCDPFEMAEAAAIGEQWGYSEINMNVGCPSDRVQSGRFGACLMAEPELVRDVVKAMQDAVSVPVSVKCRLGIDRDDSFEALLDFVHTVSDSGCRHFVVHARKAWLDGLSPRENRDIPPLRYEYVDRLKQLHPELHITINGGINSLPAVADHLTRVDGVMLGRAAYYQPACLMRADQLVFADLPGGFSHDDSVASLSRVALEFAQYLQLQVEQGVRLSALSRHAVALFQSVPGARQWRRYISEQAPRSNDAIALIEQALEHVQAPVRRQA